MHNWLLLIPLAICGYVQNMMFAWSSRSRNSGDPSYHRYAAWGANSAWFLTYVFVWGQIWNTLIHHHWLLLVTTGIVYVTATSEGSVCMMRILLRREAGKRRVGAR